MPLNDIALLLAQLELDDLPALVRIRDALVEIAFANRVPHDVQPVVARAARLLGSIIDGSASNATETLALVHDCIDLAVGASKPWSQDSAPGNESTRSMPDQHVAATPLHRVHSDRLSSDVDLELVGEFITECKESIAAAEVALLQLEDHPDDEESINTVFRAFHTVKGTSGFLELTRLSAFAHEAESLLSRVRAREIAYAHGCADLCLDAIDMLKSLVRSVELAIDGDGGIAVPDRYDALNEALASYDPARETRTTAETRAAEGGAPSAQSAPSVAVTTGASSARSRDLTASDPTIRVRIDRLDRLIDMVGELVISQSMIAGDETLEATRQHELLRKISQAGKIVRELQALSMSMRMVPLRATFQKLARVVRDTAVKAGKQVQWITDGDDIEIDRNLVDILSDPLVHMTRNSVDHGVESPTERARLGKPAAGAIRIAAYHASGNVVVELHDDGRGLDRDRIVAKAIEKGLIESEKGMTEAEIFALIFAPGFSTAEQITDISGRGVGMDVVRRNLESIRGRIDIASVAGKGTTFSIRLPLTLAVTDGMIVRVGGERFIVPLTQIHMSFRPEASMLSTVQGRGEVVLLRGELMPLVRLHRLFDVADAIESPLDGLLMIVGDADRRTALLVDELIGQQQVVAKTLGTALGTVAGISGGAILGDGRIGLILDVNETLALARNADPAGRHHRGVSAAA